jgi:hypothetical protein
LPVQPHVQSAPCITSTPPVSARLVGSQISFSHALSQEEMLARGQLSYQPAIQSARNTPIRSTKMAPAHVARSPRIAG